MSETAASEGAAARSNPPRVFSGVQPTGNLHLGNYLGAVREFVRLQDQNLTLEDGGSVAFEHRFYCVVDLHAITVQQDPTTLRASIRELTAAFLASGLEPKKSIIFNQSQVTAHAELGWIFNCVARIGWLNRMTQFKEKAGKNRENASVGLYGYPVLQAADILAYRATHVPIGEDQKQHLELSRDIAQKFNHDFGVEDFFPQPEPLIRAEAARVMSLRDGSKKMSKSDPSDLSRINLTDDADAIAQKIRKAKTDPEPLPDTLEALETRPEAHNLVSILAAVTGQSVEETLLEHAGSAFSAFKPALAEVLVAHLSPIAEEMRRLVAEPDHIDAVLADGAERAAAIAAPVLRETYDLMGCCARAPDAQRLVIGRLPIWPVRVILANRRRLQSRGGAVRREPCEKVLGSCRSDARMYERAQVRRAAGSERRPFRYVAVCPGAGRIPTLAGGGRSDEGGSARRCGGAAVRFVRQGARFDGRAAGICDSRRIKARRSPRLYQCDAGDLSSCSGRRRRPRRGSGAACRVSRRAVVGWNARADHNCAGRHVFRGN